jgi:hypothetical protein
MIVHTEGFDLQVFCYKERVVLVFCFIVNYFFSDCYLSLCVLIVKNIVSETIHLFEVT